MLTEAMPRRAVEALEIEVRKLAERIDFTREAGVDPSTIANMERGLADLREALGTLTPAESLVGFDDAVRGLSRKIDQMALQHDPGEICSSSKPRSPPCAALSRMSPPTTR